MRKSFAILTIVAAATAVHAQTNTVSSANIVGYVQTQTPAAGSFDIVSLTSFETNGVNIQDAVANIDVLNASAIKANADKLYLWSGTGYSTYGLYLKASTGERFWMLASHVGWSVPSLAAAANVTISRGQSVWFETGAGGTSTNVITSGDVPNDGTFEIDLPSTYNLIAYPYSSDINLTNLVVSNATASATKAFADKIYIWNGSGYVTYGLYYKASTSETFWMLASHVGWSVPSLAAPASATINLGKGFWYESPGGAKTIGFLQNYTL